jgi:hypothetical protein
MQKTRTKQNVAIQWIIGVLIVGYSLRTATAAAALSQKDTTSNNAVDNDLYDSIGYDKNNNYDSDEKEDYRIVHITEISKKSANDKNAMITTYQQEQTLNHNYESTVADKRLLQIESSRGFQGHKSESVYLFATLYKDQCQKNAYFPAWKIDKGSDRREFLLKINYFKEFDGKNMYLCVQFGDEKQTQIKHLGENSVFNLSR